MYMGTCNGYGHEDEGISNEFTRVHLGSMIDIDIDVLYSRYRMSTIALLGINGLSRRSL
jgi:hypothetical protein